MANCSDSGSYEEDRNTKMKFLQKGLLIPLSFSVHSHKNFDNIINIVEIDDEKIGVLKDGENFKILYDGKPFQLKIKAFCGLLN